MTDNAANCEGWRTCSSRYKSMRSACETSSCVPVAGSVRFVNEDG